MACYAMIKDVKGLMSLVQMSVLELHPWASRVDRLERPDRMIFDLDPDPAVPWADVVAAARETRDRLKSAELESFVKTTGGKGLHVVVPLARRHDRDRVRGFAKGLADAMAEDSPEATPRAWPRRRAEERFSSTICAASGARRLSPPTRRGQSRERRWRPRWRGTSSRRLAGPGADPWRDIDTIRQSLRRSS